MRRIKKFLHAHDYLRAPSTFLGEKVPLTINDIIKNTSSRPAAIEDWLEAAIEYEGFVEMAIQATSKTSCLGTGAWKFYEENELETAALPITRPATATTLEYDRWMVFNENLLIKFPMEARDVAHRLAYAKSLFLLNKTQTFDTLDHEAVLKSHDKLNYDDVVALSSLGVDAIYPTGLGHIATEAGIQMFQESDIYIIFTPGDHTLAMTMAGYAHSVADCKIISIGENFALGKTRLLANVDWWRTVQVVPNTASLSVTPQQADNNRIVIFCDNSISHDQADMIRKWTRECKHVIVISKDEMEFEDIQSTLSVPLSPTHLSPLVHSSFENIMIYIFSHSN